MMKASPSGGRSMTQAEIDELSNQELAELTKALCRQVLSRRGIAMPVAIPGQDGQPIGFLVPTPPTDLDDSDPEFFAELRRRIANPPEKYLTVEEFCAALDEEPSAASTASQ
jgi:hypothetical protein